MTGGGGDEDQGKHESRDREEYAHESARFALVTIVSLLVILLSLRSERCQHSHEQSQQENTDRRSSQTGYTGANARPPGGHSGGDLQSRGLSRNRFESDSEGGRICDRH